MSIKIYLPTNNFNQKRHSNLFGHVQIGEDNVIVYFIVDVAEITNPDTDTIHGHHHGSSDLQYLGAILPSDIAPNVSRNHDMRLCFTYNTDSPNIRLIYVGIMPENLRQIKLILYDRHILQNLLVHNEGVVSGAHSELRSEQCNNNECDFLMLCQLIQPAHPKDRKDSIKNQMSIIYLIVNLPTLFFKYAVDNKLINKLMMHTSVYKHHKEWQATYNKGSRSTNIMIDRIFGLILMMILFMFVSHPSDFLIQMSHGIINQLYGLLRVLEGSPIGMKLNIHLNNFFLDCFKYHIELWSTFLDLIEPVVSEVFLAIGVFGCLGFTYQIALLADLISIVGLHAHCFYIYTKVLYNVETKGLSVLWQVVRGNRYNILKGRTEVHNYINRQLYFATIFFSAILFLFPTTFVYYIVFATLKALTFATLCIFDYFRRNILDFPIDTRIKWITKGFYEIDCLRLQEVPSQKPPFLIYKNIRLNIAIYKLLC